MGRWHHRYAKYADLLSAQEYKGGVFRFFHHETRFQKSVFTGSMWTIGQNDAKMCVYETMCKVTTVTLSLDLRAPVSYYPEKLNSSAGEGKSADHIYVLILM